MNRRDFLYGCAAIAVANTSGLAVAPDNGPHNMTATEVEAAYRAYYKQWQNDTANIFVDYFNNTILFGIGALRQIEEYPYIESVDPADLQMPATLGGLLEKP